MTEVLKFEINRVKDDFGEIIFKSPEDLELFYDGVIHNGKNVIIIWIEDGRRKSRLLQNDDISSKITDRKMILTSEEAI